MVPFLARSSHHWDDENGLKTMATIMKATTMTEYCGLESDALDAFVQPAKNLELHEAKTPESQKSGTNQGPSRKADACGDTKLVAATTTLFEEDWITEELFTKKEIEEEIAKSAAAYEKTDTTKFLRSRTQEERNLVTDWLLSDDNHDVLHITVGTAEEALGIFVQRYSGEPTIIVYVNGEGSPFVSGNSGGVNQDKVCTNDFEPYDEQIAEQQSYSVLVTWDDDDGVLIHGACVKTEASLFSTEGDLLRTRQELLPLKTLRIQELPAVLIRPVRALLRLSTNDRKTRVTGVTTPHQVLA